MSNLLYPFQDKPETPIGGGSVEQRLAALEQAAQVQSTWLDLIPRRFGADSTVGVKSAAFTPEAEIEWFRVTAAGGAVTATVPLAASNPYRTIGFIKTDSGANAVTLTRSGSDTINGATTLALTAQYSFAIIKSNGITAWDVAGRSPLGYTLLATNTTAGATMDFITNINSTYEAYMFSLVNVLPATDDVGLWLRVYVAGVAQSGVSDYDWAVNGRSGGTGIVNNDTADSEFEMIDSALAANLAVGNASTEGVEGEVYIYNPASTAMHKRIKAHLAWSNASGNAGIIQSGGIYKGTSAVDGIQFLFESGNIASGTIRMYGLRR